MERTTRQYFYLRKGEPRIDNFPINMDEEEIVHLLSDEEGEYVEIDKGYFLK